MVWPPLSPQHPECGMWVRNLGGMASSHLNILDVGEEPGWNGLLLLGDGGRELALLDVVQPTQLLHAEHARTGVIVNISASTSVQ